MSASGSINSVFNSESSHTNDLKKLVFTASLLDFSIEGTVWSKLASSVVPLGKALNGIPRLSVVDRWSVASKRACIAPLLFLVKGE